MARYTPNPFYVHPGGDLSRGLDGLSQVLAENRAAKEEKAAQEAQQQRIQMAKQAARQALQSGDPMMVADVAMEYPEVADMLNKQAGIIDDAKKQDATQFSMALLAAAPEDRAAVYQQRIKQLSDQGRDPSHTMQSYRDYLADPEREIRGVETMFAATNPDGYKSYLEATTVKPAETREVKRGDRIVTEQWDGEKWVQIADADRFNPNSSPRVDVKVNTGSDKFTEEVAKGDASRFQAISDAGQTASRNRVRIDRLDKLLQNTGSGFTTQMKSLAGSYGIPTEGLDDIQAAEAIISSLIPEQRAPGSGQMSDADLEIFKQSLPRLINTPEGNRKIIETMKAINVYDRRLAQIASDAMAGDISRSEARKQIMAVPNPLRGFSADDAAPVEAGEAPQGVDAEIWNAMTDEEKALWQN